MTTLTVSAKGWIVIPAEIRKKYGLHPGAKVRLVDYGGGISIQRVLDDPIEEAAGILRGRDSLTTALRAERAMALRIEEERIAYWRDAAEGDEVEAA